MHKINNKNMPIAFMNQARTWVGTRFHHQGRLKSTDTHPGGVDCLGLLVGVAQELQLKDKVGKPLALCDDPTYPHMPDGVYLNQQLEQLFDNVTADAMQCGDILVLQIDKSQAPTHLAIVTSGVDASGEHDGSNYSGSFGMIHAYAQARKVVEHALDENWRKRIYAVFRVRS